MSRGRKRILLVVTTAAVTLVVLELGFRSVEGKLRLDERIDDARAFVLDGTMRGFAPHPYTVYHHPPGGLFNSFGFRDEEWALEKTPGVPRILCLGGSTTESGSMPGGTYPDILEEFLERESGRDFEVLNAGMSGWTTAEALVAWFLLLQDLEPDLVILHFAINDLWPRFSADFIADYSHWRRPISLETSGGLLARSLARVSDLYLYLCLEVEGVPDLASVCTREASTPEPLISEGKLPAGTSLPFRRNLESIAVSARGLGAAVAVMTMPLNPEDSGANNGVWFHGVRENNEHLRSLAAEHGLMLIDAEKSFAGREDLASEFTDICHLRFGGNVAKARLASEVLEQEWIPFLSSEGARPPPPTKGRLAHRLERLSRMESLRAAGRDR